MPSFKFGNLTVGSDKGDYIKKTFARTIEQKMAGGGKITSYWKEVKHLENYLGKVNDVRSSIFEGVSKLSTIARRNQMYEEMLVNDQVIKSNITKKHSSWKKDFFMIPFLKQKKHLVQILKLLK